MSLAQELFERKQEALRVVRYSEADSGSVQVQIVGLTERILSLAEHVSRNKKDFSARRSLDILVSKRRRFLSHLKNSSKEIFANVSKAIIWTNK